MLPPRICVVGSGPAGFYTVEHLLRSFQDNCRVTLLEKLPVPFGLVRFGVAPDHPEVKNVTNRFTELAAHPSVRFLGNVSVGTEPATVSRLCSLFDAVVLSTGAQRDRLLNLPREDSPGIFGARHFVEWYNGHPSVPQPVTEGITSVLLRGLLHRVVIVGQGNVALDCARVLVRSHQELMRTDIADGALAVLERSHVHEILLVGRRGPLDAAWTIAELRELTKMEGARVLLRASDLDRSQEVHSRRTSWLKDRGVEEELRERRSRERMLKLLRSCAVPDEQWDEEVRKTVQVEGKTAVQLVFGAVPSAFGVNEAGSVASVNLLQTEVTLDEESGRVMARTPRHSDGASPVENTVLCDMVLRSIGYRSEPFPGFPFDEAAGTIPNVQGHVDVSVDPISFPRQNAFVAGWLKRGPSGVIGTNRDDAEETVASVMRYFEQQQQQEQVPPNGSSVPDDAHDILVQEIKKAGGKPVSWRAALRIMQAEEERGMQAGRPRSKILDLQEMIAMAQGMEEQD